MHLFDIEALVAPADSPGEMHLHESAYSCTSLFTYPNGDKLKGIGLHTHEMCDDIELVLVGEIGLPRPGGKAAVVPSLHLVINRPASAHGYFAYAPAVVVLGFRCPKSYQGTPILGTLADAGHNELPAIIDLDDAQHSQYCTDNTLIRLHRIDGRMTLAATEFAERVLLPLAPVRMAAPTSASLCTIPMHGLVVLPGELAVEFHSDRPLLLIEFLPLAARSNV